MGNCVTWKGKLCIIVNSSVRKQVGLMTRQQKALLDMISIIITKLIEIAVNHAKIASLLFHHPPQSVFPVVMVTCSLLWVACFFFFFFLENFRFKMHLRNLGLKMSFMVLLV